VVRSEDGAVEPLVDAIAVTLNYVAKVIDALQVIIVQRVLGLNFLLKQEYSGHEVSSLGMNGAKNAPDGSRTHHQFVVTL
jgi:hypothetical protein